MKHILICFAFFLALSFGSASLRAQTFQQDTAGAYNQGVNAESQSISNFASEILDWITGTVWDDIKGLVTGAISGGFTSLGGDIESGWNSFTSLFGTHQQKGADPQTISDSTLVAKNGVFTTGFLIGTSLGLWNNTSGQFGATIVPTPTLGQKTTYTIPDPGTATASFVLDAGNQTFNGNKTFSGTTKMSGLTASQAVVTDASKNLASLGYGSTNTASTLVERDASGNFATGTISVAGVTVAVATAAIASNATVLDNTHIYYIVPANSGTSVAITPPTGLTGKEIIVENQDGTAATTGLAVPAGAVYTFIYNGTAWKHAS